MKRRKFGILGLAAFFIFLMTLPAWLQSPSRSPFSTRDPGHSNRPGIRMPGPRIPGRGDQRKRRASRPEGGTHRGRQPAQTRCGSPESNQKYYGWGKIHCYWNRDSRRPGPAAGGRKEKVIFFSYGAEGDEVTGKFCSPYTFRVSPNTEVRSMAIANFLATKPFASSTP